MYVNGINRCEQNWGIFVDGSYVDPQKWHTLTDPSYWESSHHSTGSIRTGNPVPTKTRIEWNDRGIFSIESWLVHTESPFLDDEIKPNIYIYIYKG